MPEKPDDAAPQEPAIEEFEEARLQEPAIGTSEESPLKEPAEHSEKPTTLEERILKAGPKEAIGLAEEAGLQLIPVEASTAAKLLGIAIVKKMTDPELADVPRYWTTLDERAFHDKTPGLIRIVKTEELPLPPEYQAELDAAFQERRALQDKQAQLNERKHGANREYREAVKKSRDWKLFGIRLKRGKPVDPALQARQPRIEAMMFSIVPDSEYAPVFLDYQAHKAAAKPFSEAGQQQLRHELQKINDGRRENLQRWEGNLDGTSTQQSAPYR